MKRPVYSPNLSSKKPYGFTIVELLIVIVVIGILAALVISTFSNVQRRARNQAKIAAASELVKTINAYTISTGQLPPGIPMCLPTGNEDVNGDGLGDCADVTDAASVFRSEKAATNTALQNAKITNLYFPNDVLSASDGKKFRGIEITYGSSNRGMNGVLQPYFLYFKIEGMNEDCSSPYSVGTVSNPDPLYMMVPAKNYSYSNGLTYCAFTIKHPNSL